MSCGTNSSCPDYKVLHGAVPIAWPISFMEEDIVKMQLISFCHRHETNHSGERQGGSGIPCLGMGVTSLQAPGHVAVSMVAKQGGCHAWVASVSRAWPQPPDTLTRMRMELGAAEAGAQCHPVTACDLRGDSWGRAGAACSGFAAKVFRYQRIRRNPRIGPCCCLVTGAREGRSSRGV